MGECVVYRDFAAHYLAELVPLQVTVLFLPFSLSLLYPFSLSLSLLYSFSLSLSLALFSRSPFSALQLFCSSGITLTLKEQL